MAGHFEAKKIAWRQTKDGLVLALSVHPDDLPQEMALSALNTRYMIAFSEIGDDEKPVAPAQVSAANGSPKKAWSEYHRSQQAAILCGDSDFWSYFHVQSTSAIPPVQATAGKLRDHFRITSRAELDKPEYHARWDEFVALYHMHRDRLR